MAVSCPPKGDPFLEQQKGRQPERRGSIAGRVLAASSINYGRQRTLARLQSTRDGRELEAESTLSQLRASLVQLYTGVQELSSFSLPFKAGFAAALCSVLCFVPGPLNASGAWAVLTVDMVLEAKVGLTLSQGINQTLGTMAAAALGLLVMFLAPMWGALQAYFLVLSVFLGAALVTMFKSKLDVRWNLGATVSMIVFHILILSQGELKDKMKAPRMLLVVILLGFLTAALVDLSFKPKFAGTMINELLARNFERAGGAIERCVVAYRDGIALEQVLPDAPDVDGTSDSQDLRDKHAHVSYSEILSDNAEVGKLLKAVSFEPAHGKFFWGYPWDLYKHITDNLTVALHDIAELDSCLHSEIQAPLHLRELFEDEFQCIGEECAQVFRTLGEGIRTMRSVNCHNPLERAEEGVLILEHKIGKYVDVLLGLGAGVEAEVEGREELGAIEENVTVAFQEAIDDSTFALPEDGPGNSQPPLARSDSEGSGSGRSSTRSRLADRHQDFIKRRESMSRHWDSTVQRISALSLIKFAALLIEVVAKTRYVVSTVEELETRVRLHGHGADIPEGSPEKQGSLEV